MDNTITKNSFNSIFSYFTFVVIFCFSFTQIFAQNIDSDNDGIIDTVDLDDDNDGILDVDEKICEFMDSTDVVALTWHGEAADNVSVQQVLAETVGNLTVTGSAWANAYSDQTFALPITIEGTITGATNGMFGIIPSNAPETTTDWNDGGYKFQFGSSGGMQIHHGGTDFTYPSPMIGASFKLEVDESGTMNYYLNGTLVYTNTVPTNEQYEITVSRGFFSMTGLSIVTGISSTDPNTCQNVDTDGDGIPDHLDIDSDGDGCLDAIEGAGSFYFEDTVEGQLNSNVDGNGVPTIAGPQGQGTTSDVTDASISDACYYCPTTPVCTSTNSPVTNCDNTGEAVQLYEQLIGYYDYTVVGNSESSHEAQQQCPNTELNGQSANVNIPAGSTEVKSYLIWSGNNTSVDQSVTLNGVTVTADDSVYLPNVTNSQGNYSSIADVTGLVNINGSNTVDDLQWLPGGAACYVLGAYGAWSIITVYENPNITEESQINIYYGLDYSYVDYNNTWCNNLYDINVPSDPSCIDIELTAITFEGDNYKTENLVIGNCNYGTGNTLNGSTAPNLDIDTYDVSGCVDPCDDYLNFSYQNFVQTTQYGNAIEVAFNSGFVVKTKLCSIDDLVVSVNAPDSIYCTDNAVITVTTNKSNVTYSWTGPNGFTASTSSITTNTPGIYTLLVTDGDGCTYTEIIELDYACVQALLPFNASASIFLEGFMLDNEDDSVPPAMANTLYQASALPTNQPFNQEPYNYEGDESVSNFISAAVDWVLLCLRDAEGNVVDKKAGILLANGVIVNTDFDVVLEFEVEDNLAEYFLSVHHRNHLGAMTTETILNGQVIDFSDPTIAGSNATKYVKGANALYCGDFDQNNVINNLDFNKWATGSAAIGNYFDVDSDGNCIINNLDYNNWAKNRQKVGNPTLIEMQY